ncbi:MAG TPA: cupin domain-containing protein [Stellaceae bacterium]|nr:cupin domain-containing protein [Stellaceae bacterium]
MKKGVVRVAERATRPAAAASFTGVVWTDVIVVGERPSRMRATMYHFNPGGRTNWHSHPVGQTLYCTEGIGRICFKGEAPRELEPGDVVAIPPDTWHWHGAAPGRFFAHLAMMEVDDVGNGTAWFEPVSEADYQAEATTD